MTAPRRPVELTLERVVQDVPQGSPLIVRVTTRVEPEGLEAGGRDALRSHLASLREALDSAIAVIAPGAVPSTRPDRPLAELIETYRPRQPELLDLLRDEGEISPGEHALLRQHLGDRATQAPPAGIPITERPIAAAPLETDRAPSSPRPVEELLRVYQLASLKQAGAVRARRQISFEEYMALKRHFAATEAPT